jgi:hypothetical protein
MCLRGKQSGRAAFQVVRAKADEQKGSLQLY